MIAELKGGALDTVYHTGLSLDEVLARYGASGNQALLADALMSVIAQAGDDQSVSNFYSYSPYGEAVAAGPDGGNALQYTGRENDGTGLYYYRARYYDPVLKRFISEDPIGLTGMDLNLYRYVSNNPISRTDPEGKILEIFAGVEVLVAGGSAVLMAAATGIAVGYLAKLVIEGIMGDTIGGKIADAIHRLPPLNPPPAPTPTPPAPTPAPPTPAPPATPSTPPTPAPPGMPPGTPPMPPASPPSGVPCWP